MRWLLRQRAGFTIPEMLMVLPGLLVLAAVLLLATIALVQMQRHAQAHASAADAVHQLSRRLRQDVAAAHACRVAQAADDMRITLHQPGRRVTFFFRPGQVERQIDGVTTDVWQAERLEFEAELRDGQRAGVLVITCRRMPGVRSVVTRASESLLAVPLPDQAGAADEGDAAP